MSLREALINEAKSKKSKAGSMVFESIKNHKENKKGGKNVKTENSQSDKKREKSS